MTAALAVSATISTLAAALLLLILRGGGRPHPTDRREP